MRNLRRKASALILLLVLAVTPVFATGLPVVDFSAIATAIANAVSTVQQWQREIRKWQDEYNRYVKSIQGITSGDWHTVLKEMSNMVNTAKGSSAMQWWGSDTAYDVMTGLSGTFTDILDIVSPWELLGERYDLLNKTMANIAKKTAEAKDFNEGNNGALDLAATSLDYVNLLLSTISNSGEASFDLVNDWFSSFALDKQFYKEVLQEKETEVYDSLSAYNVGNINEIVSEKGNAAQEVADIEYELANIRKEEEPQLYSDTETKLNNAKAKLAALTSAEAAIRNIKKAEEEMTLKIEEDNQANKEKAETEISATAAENAVQKANKAQHDAYIEAEKKLITVEALLPVKRIIK